MASSQGEQIYSVVGASSDNAEEPWALEPRSLRSSRPTSLGRWAAATLALGVGQ
jgi:hypothetical protein